MYGKKNLFFSTNLSHLPLLYLFALFVLVLIMFEILNKQLVFDICFDNYECMKLIVASFYLPTIISEVICMIFLTDRCVLFGFIVLIDMNFYAFVCT
jgi:hypothetical protein